ncbi:hypothetical protein GbCGDNIH4_5029 [Granulibacter bethesdensis CGDNIH4]|nr:hypothetical protein GbCGDNIH4_5029 [Granulibacter bethesdensis CGDNIH4]
MIRSRAAAWAEDIISYTHEDAPRLRRGFFHQRTRSNPQHHMHA